MSTIELNPNAGSKNQQVGGHDSPGANPNTRDAGSLSGSSSHTALPRRSSGDRRASSLDPDGPSDYLSAGSIVRSSAVSPSPHRDGPGLLYDTTRSPGSVIVRSTVSAERNDNTSERSVSEPTESNSNNEIPDLRIGPAPTVDIKSMASGMTTGQFRALQRLVGQQDYQRRKLLTAGSFLREIRTEANSLRVHAESLGGRVQRVLSDTVTSILDGDAAITLLAEEFGASMGNTPDIGGDRNEGIDQEEIDPSSSAGSGSRQDTGADAMDRELPPRRSDESSAQFQDRYERHIRRVDTTHQSWNREFIHDATTHLGRHELPPHLDRPNEVDIPHDPEDEEPDLVDAEEVGPSRNASVHLMPTHNARPRPSVQFGSISTAPRGRSFARPRGVSAYRVTQGPAESGLWNSEQYHQDVMLTKVRRIVDWKVGSDLSAPSGTKQPKLSEPMKYSGNRSHDNFCTWLDQFLNWLRSHYISGSSTDVTRLNLLGNYLEGAALDWYTAEIDNPERGDGTPILFIDAICALHKRFVHTATASDAKNKYDAVTYSASDGTEGFFYRLEKFASRMVQRPDEYSFKNRFFEGMPDWIFNRLTDREITPEYCTLDDIRSNAKQIEEMKSRIRGNPTGLGDFSQASRGQQNNSPRTRDRAQTGQSSQRTPGSRESRPNIRVRSQPSAKAPAPSGAGTLAKAAPRPPHPTSDVTCYTCGMQGHISTNPKCPQYGISNTTRPRVHAQRVVDSADEEVMGTHTDASHAQEVESHYSNSWGGSQYESDDPDAADPACEPDGAEAAPEGEDADEDDDDGIRMSTMRVNINAMRALSRSSSDGDSNHNPSSPADSTESTKESDNVVHGNQSDTEDVLVVHTDASDLAIGRLLSIAPIPTSDTGMDDIIEHPYEEGNWRCNNCRSGYPTVIETIFEDDGTSTRQFHIKCTNCLVLSPIEHGEVRPRVEARMSAMWDGGPDIFDDYFCESYEDDAWTGPDHIEDDDPAEPQPNSNELDYGDMPDLVYVSGDDETESTSGEVDYSDMPALELITDDDSSELEYLDIPELQGEASDTQSNRPDPRRHYIPEWWSPFDMLQGLTDDSRTEIYSARKKQEDPDWIPIAIPPELDTSNGGICRALLRMGYTSQDEFEDSSWIEQLAITDPDRFHSLTGYHVPPRIRCQECRECIPRVSEATDVYDDGTEHRRMEILCIGVRHNSEADQLGRSDADTIRVKETTATAGSTPLGWAETFPAVQWTVNNLMPTKILGNRLSNVELRPLPMGIAISPGLQWASNTPLPTAIIGSELVSPNVIGKRREHEPSRENSERDTKDNDPEDNLSEYSEGDEETHHSRHGSQPCEDCGSNRTRVSERVFFEGNDVITRLYIECRDCDTVAPFHPEPHSSAQLLASRLIHSATVRRRPSSGSIQPIRVPKLQATLVAEVEINGVKAFTLFDSGSTTDSLTPEFAFATRAQQITLEDQVILQLGCVGSRSKICYGTRVPVDICGVKDEVYFDLVNLDRYDCIIGTPFMNTHGVCLDFSNRSIVINGRTYPALTQDQEQLFLQNRKETSNSKRQSRLPPRETKPITKMRAGPSNSNKDI